MLTIDFEASCLPRDGRSFPIEVGIADGRGWSRAWLIRPTAEWRGWTWTEEAEGLHRIGWEQLLVDGTHPVQVMTELNMIAGGRKVVADHDLDRQWLAILADAAGIAPRFHIGHVAEVIDRCRPCAASMQRALWMANARVPARHRAGPDALWLAYLLANLTPASPALFDWNAESAREPASSVA